MVLEKDHLLTQRLGLDVVNVVIHENDVDPVSFCDLQGGGGEDFGDGIERLGRDA